MLATGSLTGNESPSLEICSGETNKKEEDNGQYNTARIRSTALHRIRDRSIVGDFQELTRLTVALLSSTSILFLMLF
jgi:hypothetical protein